MKCHKYLSANESELAAWCCWITITTVIGIVPSTRWWRAHHTVQLLFSDTSYDAVNRNILSSCLNSAVNWQFQLCLQLIPQTRYCDRKSTLSNFQSSPGSKISVSWCTECRSGRDFCNWSQKVYNVLWHLINCHFVSQQAQFVLDPGSDWQQI